MSLTTYHCHWCGRDGTAIQEQLAELRFDLFPPTRRYSCNDCGQDVEPGPHGGPAYGCDLSLAIR